MKGDFMRDQIASEEAKATPENRSEVTVKTKDDSVACSMHGKGWLKGSFGMAICCGAPLLLIAAISFFGLPLEAITGGALRLVALLACPVGMFLMMRMMKDKK
jgi:hypothetical protein